MQGSKCLSLKSPVYSSKQTPPGLQASIPSVPEGNWVITSSWGHSQDIPPLANHFLLLSGNSLEAHNSPTPLPLPTDHHQSFSPRLPPPPPNPYPGALLRALRDFFLPQGKSFYLTHIIFLIHLQNSF